jgi:AcrR family transcriptional regulator
MHDPRVLRSRAAVLEAAVDVLAAGGSEGFSIDAVAKRAGVARTTIYRHWADVDELLVDAMSTVCVTPPSPDTGSVRDDLVALYTALVARLSDTRLGEVLPVMLDLARRDESLRPLHGRFIADRRRPSVAAVQRGIERGELPAGTDAQLVVDRIAGPIFYRFLVVQDPYSAADVERLVTEVLDAQRPAGARYRRRR